MTRTRPHVVIIGGGFGGLAAARALARAPVDITLIDRRNHHLFQPLLYQVATAGLNPADIAYPIRSILRKQKNVRVLLAAARRIDPETRTVVLDSGELSYDYLVVATGATHSYFGNDAWAAHAPGLKTVEDALEIRRRVLLAYEAAERETDPEAQQAWLTFAVVGAGPTGVELAGALAEIGRYTLARDFRHIDPTKVRVVLVEAAERVLPPYPDELSEKAHHHLKRLGVTVRTGARVTHLDQHGLDIGAERIPTRTVLWAAGVAASPVAAGLGVPLDRSGRVMVEADLSVPDHPEVFVIGDLAAVVQDGRQVPAVAPAAVQGGQQAGRCIAASLGGRPRPSFHYRDKGSMATIGRAAAVVHLGRMRLSGFVAWMMWWLVHILFLIGFRNRFLVLFAWAWSYLTYQRGARLITGTHAILPRVEMEEDEDDEDHLDAIPAAAPVTLPEPPLSIPTNGR
ncbi:NAD(P)/FAD-dependent oxidoreductase [Haliangium sp.]|uniref:NAD(P)/FAD-dependent oxidoreductase n=1 Tax=Haliangium sp. TaxID=2663208 RepID=UPI003D113BFA